MILEKQKTAVILSNSSEEIHTTEMSLDKNSEQLIMQMFGKSMYSDPIGSIVREWTSNAVDSHRRLKTDSPVIVSLKRNEENSYEFTVEDFGMGLSAYEVDTVISQYGKSTKRDKANEIGGWGIGWKSGLAYSSVFYFICRQNGIENKYMMYEGEYRNAIDLLNSCETTEKDGVKMILPVKDSDSYDFGLKIKEQLCYFENVYFDIEKNPEINKFTIARTEDYQISSLCADPNLHISLDDVYYPIDFSKLGINRVEVPIALRFRLNDGIIPIPNRESLLYNNKTKQLIIDKIKEVSTQITKKYNKQVKDLGEIYEIVSFYDDYLHIGSTSIYIESLEEYTTIAKLKPNLKCFKYLNFRELYRSSSHYLLNTFTLKGILKDGSIRKPSKNFRDFTLGKISGDQNVMYLLDKPITFKQKEYVKTLHSTRKNVYFLEYKNFRKLGNTGRKWQYDDYYNLLTLNNFDKKLWRDVIKEFQAFVELFKLNCINISDVVVPVEHIEKIKKEKATQLRVEKPEGYIAVKKAVEYVYDNNQCKFIDHSYEVEMIKHKKEFIVYALKEDTEKLKINFNVYRSISFLVVSQKDFEILNKLNYHNCMNIQKFEKGSSKHFKRVVTALLIRKLREKNKKVFHKLDLVENTSNLLYTSLKKLAAYEDTFLAQTYIQEDLIESMISLAQENNLFDASIYSLYLSTKEKLEKLDFLVPYFTIISNSTYGSDSNNTAILNMLFKYKKQRINKEHYNIKTN